MSAAQVSGSDTRNVGKHIVASWSLIAGLLLGSPVRAETAESLLANPQRLELVQAACKAGMAWTTADLCNAVAQAIRMRFQGGGVPYTPQNVDLGSTRPTMSPSAPSSANPPTPPTPRAKSRTRIHRLAGAEATPLR